MIGSLGSHCRPRSRLLGPHSAMRDIEENSAIEMGVVASGVRNGPSSRTGVAFTGDQKKGATLPVAPVGSSRQSDKLARHRMASEPAGHTLTAMAPDA